MAVPVSNIVTVNITASPTPLAAQGFGTLIFMSNEADSVFAEGEKVRTYSNAAGVGEDFSADSEVQAAANAYFGQSPTPAEFMVGRVETLTEGGAQESIVEALTNAEIYNDAFYGVAVDRTYRDSNVVKDICDWVQGREKQLFICSNDVNMTSIATHNQVAIKDALDAQYSRTHFVYGANASEYPEVSTAGRAFTVNFRGTNTTLTLFLKKLPGITVNDFSTSQREAVKALKVNAYVNVAGNAVYLDGVNGDGTFFDQVHGLDWLKNAIQTNVFNLLYLSPTKIPYNDAGTATLAGGVRQALDQGIRNGLISAGSTADGTYLSAGYEITTIPVADVSQADKGNRIYGGISFQAVGAGAIHEVVISGTFTG